MDLRDAIRTLEAMRTRKLAMAKAPMPYLSRSEAANARDRHAREAEALGVVLSLLEIPETGEAWFKSAKLRKPSTDTPPGYGYVSDLIAHVTRVEGDEYVCDRCHKRWGLDEREEPPCTD